LYGIGIFNALFAGLIEETYLHIFVCFFFLSGKKVQNAFIKSIFFDPFENDILLRKNLIFSA